ncbi:hypothetical protein ABW20_dc0106239 [Dactylellina cionopaga]|nr:hypothetical protein ABW20_dc0106239 [Dactylellina cionopaga]
MLFKSTLLPFVILAAVRTAFGHVCEGPAPTCSTITTDLAIASSCSDFFTSKTVASLTCTETSTAPTPVTTVFVTKTVTSTSTSTSTSTFTSTQRASTVTIASTTTKTTTTTSTDTTITTSTSLKSVTSGTYTNVLFPQRTTTITSWSTETVTITGSPPVVPRLRRRGAAVPDPCSCFRTTTTVVTKTPSLSTFKSTTSSTTVKTATSTVHTTTTTALADITVTKVLATTISTVTATTTSTKSTKVTSTTVFPAASTTVFSTTTTTTYVSPPTPDATCGNGGLGVGIYDDVFIDDQSANYASFKPEYFKTIVPFDTKTSISNLGINNAGDAASPHGFQPHAPGDYVLNYRGYFYAPVTSTYTFVIFNGDNWAGIWLGPKAVSAWTRSNADATTIWNPTTSFAPPSQYHISLTAGSYTPFRLIIGSFAGAVSYKLLVVDAQGNTYIEYGVTSPYLVAFDCDETAPPFPAFGDESTAGPTPDTTCNNAGFDVGIYDDPFDNDQSPDYATFVPEYFKTVTPYDRKKTTSLGLSTLGDANAPHGFAIHATGDYVLNYRGYFYAPVSTTYTIRVAEGDNWAGFWTSTALSGWTRANADASSIWNPGTSTSTSGQVKVAIAAGTYYPIRFLIGSFAGFVHYKFEILDEASGIFYLQYGAPSPYLVDVACDGSVGAYPEFGAEV